LTLEIRSEVYVCYLPVCVNFPDIVLYPLLPVLSLDLCLDSPTWLPNCFVRSSQQLCRICR